jgi:oligosaccharide repeat unit polymerase
MIPTAVGLLITAILAFLNFSIGRSVLYPPAQLCLIWSALLGTAMLSGSRFFSLSAESITVFSLGALAFSAGGALRLAFEQQSVRLTAPRPPSIHRRELNWLLTAALVLLIVFLPAFWRYIVSLADPRFSNLWWGIRAGTIAASEMQGLKSLERILYDNLSLSAILLALTAMAYYGERGMSRLVANSLLIVATLYNLATASRAGASTVVLGAVGIRMLKGRKVSWRHLIAGVVAVLVMYVPITLLRSKTGDPTVLVKQDVDTLVELALLYAVGPLAAFDAYVQNPAAVTETWSILHFFYHGANRLGFDVVAPSSHMGYVAVCPTAATNVYTMYFAYYPDFGILGVIVLTAIVGYFMVWLYCAVLPGSRNWLLVLYALAFEGTCKSGFNEAFYFGLNMWVKTGLFCLMLYALDRIVAARAMGPANRYPAETGPVIART